VRGVVLRVTGGINDVLHHFRRPLRADGLRNGAPGPPFDERDDIRGRFFEPTEVNKTSTSSASGGVGEAPGAPGAGRRAWAALTRFDRLVLIEGSRPLRRSPLPST
jgi:hypothetical protein